MKNLDKTSWIGALACVALLFVWGWWSAKESAKKAEERAKTAEVERIQKEKEEKENPSQPTPPKETSPDGKKPDGETKPEIAERTFILENELVRFHLTNRGASVAAAELLDQKRHLDGSDGFITINQTASHGVATFSTGPAQFDETTWKVTSSDDSHVTFATDTPDKLHFEKTFRLPAPDSDPHELQMEITIRNDSDTPTQTGSRFLYTGTASPLHLNEWSMQIGFYWMDDDDFEYKTVDHFGGKKVLGIFGKDNIPDDEFSLDSVRWAGVNDQFFTTLIKPATPYQANLWASRFPVVVEGDKEASLKKRMNAAEAALGLPTLAMNAGDQTTLKYDIYLGPKEYARLASFGDDRKRVMHYDQIPIFGFLFGWAIKPLASFLLTSLVTMKGIVGSYGLAIIIVTIAIRLLIWPIYAKSARSMKRMSKLTPKMQEIREKYKDEPQKMNEATMSLYREYNVNPLGGCLPMFIQLPVFLAFYRMLWSAVELRHESFLWVTDLSMPDTLFEIPGLNVPFNLLPILMAISTFIQMAITPKTGDRTQQMIFMFMPFIFLFICYNFAAALSLYWTTSNTFSILQTWIMNKLPEPELKKRAGGPRKGFMQRMQEQADAAQKAKAGGPGGANRTKLSSERGERHTKSRKKKR